jgi:hypothetical protein
MLIPVLIFVVAAFSSAVACSYWLPDLAAGSVGGLAFFLVCGLAGAAVGLLSMQIYSLVVDLEHFGAGSGALGRGEIVGEFLREVAFEVPSVLGFAAIVYLLAPAPEPVDDLYDEPVPEPAAM